MVYVERLKDLIVELKRKAYILKSFDEEKTIYQILMADTHIPAGQIICKNNNVTGYNAHIVEIMDGFVEKEKITLCDDALAAIED